MRHCRPFVPWVPVQVFSLDALVSRLDEHGATPSFLIDGGPGPEQAVEAAEEQRAVRHFVETLSSRDKDILNRVFWQDQTQTAVAADYRVSKMAISKLIARIVKSGQTALAAYR